MEPRLKSHKVPLYTVARNSRNADQFVAIFTIGHNSKFLDQTYSKYKHSHFAFSAMLS